MKKNQIENRVRAGELQVPRMKRVYVWRIDFTSFRWSFVWSHGWNCYWAFRLEGDHPEPYVYQIPPDAYVELLILFNERRALLNTRKEDAPYRLIANEIGRNGSPVGVKQLN